MNIYGMWMWSWSNGKKSNTKFHLAMAKCLVHAQLNTLAHKIHKMIFHTENLSIRKMQIQIRQYIYS